MWETTGDGLFHWRKCYYGLWTQILDKNILMMDLFLTKVLFHFRWCTGVVWIICGLLWCFYHLFDSHSDGTHSLQSIHWWAKWWNDTFLQSVLMKKHMNCFHSVLPMKCIFSFYLELVWNASKLHCCLQLYILCFYPLVTSSFSSWLILNTSCTVFSSSHYNIIAVNFTSM